MILSSFFFVHFCYVIKLVFKYLLFSLTNRTTTESIQEQYTKSPTEDPKDDGCICHFIYCLLDSLLCTRNLVLVWSWNVKQGFRSSKSLLLSLCFLKSMLRSTNIWLFLSVIFRLSRKSCKEEQGNEFPHFRIGNTNVAVYLLINKRLRLCYYPYSFF